MQTSAINTGVPPRQRIPLEVTQSRKLAEAGEGYRADEMLALMIERNVFIAPDCQGYHPTSDKNTVVRRFFLTMPVTATTDEVAQQTKLATELLDYLFHHRSTPPAK